MYAHVDKLTDSLVKCGALEKLPRLLLLEQPLIVKEMGLKALSVLCESGMHKYWVRN